MKEASFSWIFFFKIFMSLKKVWNLQKSGLKQTSACVSICVF